MWSKSRAAVHQRALAVAQKHKPAIEKLEKMAEYAPAFKERMRELRLMRDNLEALAKVATAIDPTGSDT